MRRVGAEAAPAEFTAALARALRLAQSISDDEIRRRFGTTRAYEDFCALLHAGAPPHGGRILAIGSGEGMGGRRAVYPASVVRDRYDGAAAVEELNWDDKLLEENADGRAVRHGGDPLAPALPAESPPGLRH